MLGHPVRADGIPKRCRYRERQCYVQQGQDHLQPIGRRTGSPGDLFDPLTNKGESGPAVEEVTSEEKSDGKVEIKTP